ncbi:hypothetical protein F5984_24040 [Rudanella paleaurantiibacter]|uniref:Transaldolase n=1 Tax=Rudanella paleaurantiibacter TaxID=2614655 RepID=A0A7J5TSX4_9BACT|nr:transaldolase family protein [Rudanella paleaurantiibacter]KAB7726700.1 hypothetical protein F5984_24040 [Rudanella paleaurantiibacter]
MSIWIAGTVEEVFAASKTGLVNAIVTNPTVIAGWTKGGQTLESVASDVISATQLPLYMQLHGPTQEHFLRETAYLKRISDRIIPKLPATREGLAAAAELEANNTETLITTVCSVNQAYASASAHATTICPYFSRVRDASEDAIELIRNIATLYRRWGVKTHIRPASVRSVQDVQDCLLAGADGVIIFYDVFEQLFLHPVTEQSLQAFEADWEQTNRLETYPFD